MGKKGPVKENTLLDNVDAEEDLVFFGINVLDEKQFTMFIKKCEFLCRKSQEYDVWQRRTKILAVNQNSDPERDDSETCPTCGINYQWAAPESHHHPVTLFNLCVRQFQDWVDENLLLDKQPLDLVQEVMEKHLCNEVEHVVLCKHCHEKYHNGEQITAEMLQKIIDYKRSIKIKESPTSVREILEKRRDINQGFVQARREFRKETLFELGQNETKEDLLRDLLNDESLQN